MQAPVNPWDAQHSADVPDECTYEKYRYWIYRTMENEPDRRKTVLRRLDIGEHVRRLTRMKLEVGAGNLKDQVALSGEESMARAQHVVPTSFEFTNYLRLLAGQTGVDPPGVYGREPHAIAARWLRAGNCDEFAMVSFYILVKLNIGEFISMIGCADPGHHVTLIGNTDDPLGGDAVVVDAWPSQGCAVLYKDWCYSHKPFIIRMNRLSDGTNLLKPVRAILKQGGLTRLNTEVGFTTKRRTKQRTFILDQTEWHMWTDTHTMTQDRRRELMAWFKKDAFYNGALYEMDTNRRLA